MVGPRPVMMFYLLPDDRDLLAAVGALAIRHGQMDDALRMIIKSFDRLTPEQARKDLAYVGSRDLRERITKRARGLRHHSARARLKDLLERSRRASKKRNDLLHGVWAQIVDGPSGVLDHDTRLSALPQLVDLNALADELAALTSDMHEARLTGFLRDAIEAMANGQ